MRHNPEQPARKDGRDSRDRIASQPRVAKFSGKKLTRRFCAGRPSQQLIDSAAAVFRANWQQPDQIKRTVRHVLLSDAAFNNWGQKRRRPFEAVAAALRLSGRDWTPNVDDDKSGDRKSVVSGKRVSVRVDLGGRRSIKKTKQKGRN